MKKKHFFSTRSKFLAVMCTVESMFAIFITLAFVYSDSLNYTESALLTETGAELLIENIYSSTWWGLIIFLLSFASIFSITSLVYKKLEYQFVSILCWIMLGIISINIGDPIIDILANLAIFIPITILNIIAYQKHKKAINKYEQTPKVEIKPIKKIKTNKKSI